MRKRDSKRRWKARCRAGRPIPATAIAMHGLDRWFEFRPSGAEPLHIYVAAKEKDRPLRRRRP